MAEGGRGEIAVQLLGGFAARRGDRWLSLRPSVQRLVALLAIEGHLARGEVAVRLFEDHTLARAAANLRTVLWRSRDDANGRLVREEGGGLRVSADIVDFVEVVRWSSAMVQRDASFSSPPDHIGRELLPGWSDEWLVYHREYLRLAQLHALEASAERLLLAGRFREAVTNTVIAVSMDPLRETANRLLIEVLIREGNAIEAVRRYRRFERVLRSEVNAEPGAAVNALIAPLLTAGYAAPRARQKSAR